MAFVYSGVVTTSIPVSGVVVLTFTDASSGVVNPVTSRTLVITDPNGTVLDTISMGSSLTATYGVESDQWLLFSLTVIDADGTHTGETSYLSTAFYNYQYPQSILDVSSVCGDTFGVLQNLSNSQLYYTAAEDAALFGQAVAANTLIIQANFLLQTPYYA